ncbi:Smr/MutS family protein [Cryomorphaceae bacterium 1068]|nr:Smr/MutS family protein [Cryomorphaceae bacterium 1068]
MKFKIGDQVAFLNEVGGGLVIGYEGELVSVENEDGFAFLFPEDELVLKVDWHPKEEVTKKKSQKLIRPIDETDGYKMIAGKMPYMEVDLHIHMVVDSSRNLSNHDMVIVQLNHFEKTLAEARRRRLTKVVYIHGIGKGRLRNELRKRLKSLSNCDFEDADYSRYGLGATQVKLWYN